jgi:thiol-disulfide isomerase/thioredoxin
MNRPRFFVSRPRQAAVPLGTDRQTRGAAFAGLILIPLLAVCLTATAPSSTFGDDAETPRAVSGAPAGTVHALLINGGSNPEINFQSHLHHLEDMVDILGQRGVPPERIHIFSADGGSDEADLAVRDLRPDNFWLIAGLPIGRRLQPETELTDTRWEGVNLQAARLDLLRAWFAGSAERFTPADQLLLFVTDHGTENLQDPDNGFISLWKEQMSVQQLKELLALLPAGMRTVLVMSQCYSGSFAGAMFDAADAEPSGEVCGFFSAPKDLPAYGCYAEGRDRDRIGHAFRFIRALERQATAGNAHLEVLVTDTTPDVPLRTSDAYLESILVSEAVAKGESIGQLTDRLLDIAWRDRGAWEPEIRLLDRLGDAYGAFSPRSLAEIETYSAALPDLIEQMKTYADRWQVAADGVKGEILTAFMEEHDGWKERLEPDATRELDVAAREALLDDLLPELERFARGRKEAWTRLNSLRARLQQARAAGWRLTVRRAALHRMRASLIGIAARTLLEPTARGSNGDPERVAQRRDALDRLESCEAIEPGALPVERMAERRWPEVDSFPPLADELATLAEVLPSWLGVQFGRVPPAMREGRDLTSGSAFLQAVFPASPAKAAGLEAGDIVLGAADRTFVSYGDLREWAMTSPRDEPLNLQVLRAGTRPEEDEQFTSTLILRPYPLEWPKLPGPPQVGDRAPLLPDDLLPVAKAELPAIGERRHLLFFWATWCAPCKAAVPELLAFAAAQELTVLAISDEDPDKVAAFLGEWKKPFFTEVVVDPRRRSYIAYGISGTPTIVLVDEGGTVRFRQVGYNQRRGLPFDDWSWERPEPPAAAPAGEPVRPHRESRPKDPRRTPDEIDE